MENEFKKLKVWSNENIAIALSGCFFCDSRFYLSKPETTQLENCVCGAQCFVYGRNQKSKSTRFFSCAFFMIWSSQKTELTTLSYNSYFL